MVEEKVEPGGVTWRHRLPWTEIFQGFRIALDPNKLILAAAGILCMAFGWWLLALIFYSSTEPGFNAKDYSYTDTKESRDQAWRKFKADRQKWNLMHAAAGPADSEVHYDAGDIAESWQEYEAITALQKSEDVTTFDDLTTRFGKETVASAQEKLKKLRRDPRIKPSGSLST